MGEEGATIDKAPVPDVDDRWLDDDGRDHGFEKTPALASAMWWCVGAGVMLLLPRQWASSGIAFALAITLAIIKRRRHPPPPKPSKGAAPPAKASEADDASKKAPEAERHA